MQRILVVDDNEDILEVIKLVLEDYGYEVLTLSDGLLLPGKINQYKPDLILLDVMLGNTDGRELCKKIKSDPVTHGIPVILVSAGHNLADRLKLSDSPDDFIAKPYDIHELLDKIHTHICSAA
ncbi:MAG TPA: response regulator [Mucilaginibacter sp.]|nr:response regulator [Mucilaginibacter sp.]